MKTSKEFNVNLKKGIITLAMIAACLESVDKRAKNHQAKENEYRREIPARYGNAARSCKMKKEYSAKRDKLLDFVEIEPMCIHSVNTGGIRTCRSATQRKYEKAPETYYFLYYQVNGNSFHKPISEDPLDHYDTEKVTQEYSDLDIVAVGLSKILGCDIKRLISAQFVAKVIKVLEDGTAELRLD